VWAQDAAGHALQHWNESVLAEWPTGAGLLPDVHGNFFVFGIGLVRCPIVYPLQHRPNVHQPVIPPTQMRRRARPGLRLWSTAQMRRHRIPLHVPDRCQQVRLGHGE